MVIERRAWLGALVGVLLGCAEDPPSPSPVIAALVPAWEAGLMRIVTIPCRGEHTRVIGDSALLVTDATRADPELYSAALASFTRHAEPGA